MSMLRCPSCNALVDTDEDEMDIGVITNETVCIDCADREHEEMEERAEMEEERQRQAGKEMP